MNNKNYIVLLSLFVACTGRAMKDQDLFVGLSPLEKTRYLEAYRHGQLNEICAIEKEIREGVSDLRNADNFTQDAVFAKIKNALKSYESNPKIACTLRKVYQQEAGLSWREFLHCDVWKYDVDETGSRVALITNPKIALPVSYMSEYRKNLYLYEERSPGNWVCSWSREHEFPKYIYLLNKGKQLVWYNLQNEMTLENPYQQEVIINEIKSEVREKHRKNFKEFIGGPPREINILGNRPAKVERPEKEIEITADGFTVRYTPTLQEIAKYLVSKAQ